MLIKYTAWKLYSGLFGNNGTGDPPRPLLSGTCHNKTPVHICIFEHRYLTNMLYSTPTNLFLFNKYHQLYTGVWHHSLKSLISIYFYLQKKLNHKLVLSKGRNLLKDHVFWRFVSFRKKEESMFWYKQVLPG